MLKSKVPPKIPPESQLKMKNFVAGRLEASGLYKIISVGDDGILLANQDAGENIFVMTHTSLVTLENIGKLEDTLIADGNKIAHIFYGDGQLFRQQLFDKRGSAPQALFDKYSNETYKTALELRGIEAWASVHHDEMIAYYRSSGNNNREVIELVHFVEDHIKLPLINQGYPYSVHVRVPESSKQISYTPIGFSVDKSDNHAAWADASILEKLTERYESMLVNKRNYGLTLKNLEEINIDVQRKIFDGQKQCYVPHNMLKWLNPGEIIGLYIGISEAKSENLNGELNQLHFVEAASYLINNIGYHFPAVLAAHHNIPNQYPIAPGSMQERLEVISLLHPEEVKKFMVSLGKYKLYSNNEAIPEGREADYHDPGVNLGSGPTRSKHLYPLHIYRSLN
jgi:hypothetical protein